MIAPDGKNRCLHCYQPLQAPNEDYHTKCLMQFFGTRSLPSLEIEAETTKLRELANQNVKEKIAIQGWQPKISIGITEVADFKRLTVMGQKGRFILKPQTEIYDNLPENESLTMHLAKILGIDTVPHTLVKLKDDSLAYLTRRIDRIPTGGKLHMEDMCQLTERITEDKYKGSMEQIGKIISKYSIVSGYDLGVFFEITLFFFLDRKC